MASFWTVRSQLAAINLGPSTNLWIFLVAELFICISYDTFYTILKLLIRYNSMERFKAEDIDISIKTDIYYYIMYRQ